MTKPDQSKLFYVPQKPYLALGTLRDQIIYPYSSNQNESSDASLKKILCDVKLEYLIQREGGFDAVADWADVLRFVQGIY